MDCAGETTEEHFSPLQYDKRLLDCEAIKAFSFFTSLEQKKINKNWREVFFKLCKDTLNRLVWGSFVYYHAC